MTCPVYRDRESVLEDYACGALERTAAAEVEAHLSACEECRAAVKAASFAGRMLRASFAPALPPTEFFWTRLNARLDEEDEKRSRATDFLPEFEWFARRLALGAGVALLLLGGYVAGTELVWLSDRAQSSEVREMVPRPAQPPANGDEVLVMLASEGNGR